MRKTLDHLFVAPEEIHAYTQRVFGLVEQRAYEIYQAHGSAVGRALDDWIQAESELFQPITAEASDAGDALIAIAAVDGYQPEDLRVSVEPRSVTICGLTNGDKKSGSSGDGLKFACFSLSFKLPADVDPSAASADLRREVLEVRMPKVHSQKET